jgi:putative ATPase
VSDLFDMERSSRESESGPPSADTPLADRMRPRSLDEVEGPEEVLGSNGFLRRSIAEDRVP